MSVAIKARKAIAHALRKGLTLEQAYRLGFKAGTREKLKRSRVMRTRRGPGYAANPLAVVLKAWH